MKVCAQCNKNRSERFYVSERGRICASCRKYNRSKSAHAARVKETYGLSTGDYDALFAAQNGACAICGGTRDYRLAVDHDHKTGFVRGLACKRCNSHLLPASLDDPSVLRKAAVYLENPPAYNVIGQKKANIPDA
jgi:hypothetical protein